MKNTIQTIHLCHVPATDIMKKEYPFLESRHPGRWALNLALAQAREESVTPSLGTIARDLPTTIQENVEGVPVRFFRSTGFAPILTGHHAQRREICKWINHDNPDIVHAHGTEHAYALAALDSSKPMVITAQGLMFMIRPILKPSLFSWQTAIRFWEHQALRKAKHVIAKSAVVAEALIEQYPHLILHSIPNTFDPRILSIDEKTIPKSIGFLGSICKRKGFDLIRKAIIQKQSLHPLEFHIIGDCGGKGNPFEENEIELLKNALTDRLHLHGKLPTLDAVRVLAKCQVLVAPSREEMFGNQLIEAMLVKVPAIVAEGTGLAENARRFGGTTVVPQDDHRALAAAIADAFKSTPDDSARNNVIRHMGPDIIAKKHADLYSEILSES